MSPVSVSVGGGVCVSLCGGVSETLFRVGCVGLVCGGLCTRVCESKCVSFGSKCMGGRVSIHTYLCPCVSGGCV